MKGKILWLWISLFEAIIFIMALAGIFATLRSSPFSTINILGLILSLMVIYFVATPGLEVDLRYRYPAEPFICLLAGLFVTAGIRKGKTDNQEIQ